ncbi:MAG: hypothetical protein D4R73_09225 [Deltaproteobacteria bacterium]|nr:MAG: hypothetical protein D4R73_09225 [Deltaproteobacteria bacterium]
MSEAIQFTGRVIRETDMAILFRADDWQPDGSDDTWLPKSQIAIIHGEGDAVQIELPEWLADDKEMT